MKYITFLIIFFGVVSCSNENDSIVIWENDKYQCTVKKEVFNKRLDNYTLAKNNEGRLTKALKKKIEKTTKNMWLLAGDEETQLMLENWRNRFYWDNNLTFINKTSNQIITTVIGEKINDPDGTIDIVIIGTDTLFKARSIIY